MTAITARIQRASPQLKLFALATFTMGMGSSVFDTVFNNFLDDRFDLSGFQRSFLEFPRELPGFIVLFVSALLWFLCSRRLGAVAMVLSTVGALLIGFGSSTYFIMIAWLFIFSLGQHTYMPLATTIGMELSKEGKDGQRLGQLNAVRNTAAIIGSAFVFIGFRYLGMNFQHAFILVAIASLLGAVVLFSMQPGKPKPAGQFLKLHKEYKVYYLLTVLSGSRKQLFITFAPWVLVTIFQQPTQTIATLMTIGGVIGILFQPFLGWAVDRFGERKIIASEAVLLVVVCFGYGFSKSLFAPGIAFLVTCGAYLLDQMLFSVGIARSTYMKKIALDPADVQPALTAGVTIDHIFSISIALIGGVIWNTFGFQYVFLMGVFVAVLNFIVAMQIRIPSEAEKKSALT